MDGSDHEGLERQPFLESDEGPAACEKLHNGETSRLFGSASRWRLITFLLFVVATIFGLFALVALPLSYKSPQHRPEAAQEHPVGYQEDHVEDHASGNQQGYTSATIHYNDDFPDAPRVRDMSEYILNSSWDLESPPATREYHWIITDADLNPDGVYRPMMLINNQFPGPLVECNEGDTIVVHIDNRAVNATAIHFHGLFQNGTNFMDGTVGVTQCAIAPRSSFTYRFDVRRQSGTYWYHAHHSAQASDGLLGPVVVHSNNEHSLQKLGYETDRIVMIQDHYHNTTAELLMDYLKPDMENNEPVPDNALINGRGVRNCSDFPGSRCDDSNVSAPVFDLAAGKRHRLRIINVGAFAEFQIQFDEHPFYVTEVDGTDVYPEPFHRLNILPAQRYSIIIEANSTLADAFWMRTRMVTHCFKLQNDKLEPEARAIIRYISPDKQYTDEQPTSKDWPEAIEVLCRDLDTSLLHPVEGVRLPPADDIVNLKAAFHIGAWRLSRGLFNGSSWHANATHPSLHRFLDASSEVTSLGSSLAINDLAFERDKEFVLQTTGVRTVDFVINNFDDGAHPFHLHGHKFFVVMHSSSGGPPPSAELPAFLHEHGTLHNPLRRDTVTVNGYGWAVIRVVLDNPGLWTFHCHNTWHAEAGMAMQMLVRSEVVREWKVDPEHRDLCKREGVARGMRPDDSIWFGQF